MFYLYEDMMAKGRYALFSEQQGQSSGWTFRRCFETAAQVEVWLDELGGSQAAWLREQLSKIK
jgi:hypothetical protein